MTAHWTRQIAKSLESGRPSRAIETHLDALLLWLANPDNSRASDLDKAIEASRLDRGRAATRAYQLLDQALFPTDQQPSAATLGLPQDADQNLAKQRYRRLIQVYHPDRHPDKTAWATQHTEQINRAFDAFRRAEASDKGATTSSTQSEETPPGPSTPGDRITHALAWIQSWTRPQPWRELIARPKARRWAGAILATALILALAPLFHETPKPRPKIIHHPLGEVHKTPPKETVAPEPRPLAQAEPDSHPAPEETDAIPPAPPKPTRTSDTPTEPEAPLQIAQATPEVPPTPEPAPAQETTAPPEETNATDASSNQTSTAPAASPSLTETEPQQETAPAEPSPESTDTPKASEPASPPTEPNGLEPETTWEPLVPPMPSIGQEPPNLAPIIEQPSIQPGLAPEPAPPLQPELQIPSTPAPTPPTPPQSPQLPLRLGAAPAITSSTRGRAQTAAICSQVPARMQAFQHNYQSGSLDDFMALYSPLAKENDLGTWFAIRQTYRQWFATTRARRIDFDQLRVKPTADGKRCAAIATFEVIFLNSDSKLERRKGAIQILFEQRGAELLILRVRY
ncbi:heat shock protein DnaJ domain protein [Thiorhodococcus drewsii AZ1]|uniref:Heat shock protein DnaJ domain protein n=1 Tax=Thiorhodococcus drewsii AZ1 TaxID=765913 RepID=G2DZ38_9GAMM|nr:J domain-containing protein [Thiorhodococcus drewsii]EGV32392.1 heat shock protein DnaJ domain protein [Thiorhodococcus drewsii AZ1]